MSIAKGNGQIDKSRCGEVCAAKGHSSKTWIGYVGAIVAIIFFGTNFIPVKKFDTGDGMFFQWVLCVGIWLVGLVVNLIRHQPPFYYPALIGGFLWTFGTYGHAPGLYTTCPAHFINDTISYR